MKAGKAYISSLGTTGLLIASSLLLLLVVGTIVAFDRWPDSEPSRAEDVAVGVRERALRARSATVERRAQARTERRRAAAVQRRRARVRPAPAGGDQSPGEITGLGESVVSDLPAPESDGSAGEAPGGASPGAAGGGTADPPGGGGGSGGGETTRQLGDAVSNISPQAGAAIGDVADALGTGVEGAGPALGP